MRMLRIAIAVFGMAALLTACNSRSPSDEATAGASPEVRRPVGPVPGPGRETHPPANPYAGDPVAMQEGRRLFVRYNCSGCHGGHAGGGMGPSLRDPEWMYGKRPSDVFGSIAEGRAHGMPAWGTLIPEQQIWKLVAYIETLGTSSEAEPPG